MALVALPGPEVWSALLARGLPSTAVAYLLLFRFVARAGTANVMLVTLLIPVSTIALGAVFLGEALSARQIAVALVIGAGILFIDGRAARLIQRPA